MPRKRKKTRKQSQHRKQNVAQLTPEAREQQAIQSLEAGQFKEVIAHCKELLKLERRPEWVEMLAKAYRGRASNLADKGMLKEAAAIWRNRAELCGTSLCDPLFFQLLMATGQIDEALALFTKNQSELEQGRVAAIREQFAAMAIAGFEQVLKALPANDPVVQDYPAAMGALNAYCQEKDEQIQEQLKGIPFRSPYRDLRQILKALLLPADESKTAFRLLTRISDKSPFVSLAHALEIGLQPNALLFSRLPEECSEICSFIAATKGWSKQQIQFIHELTQLGQSPSPDTLIRLLIRSQKLLGDDFTRQACLRLLIRSPKSSTRFKRAFGRLTPLEQAAIKAQGLTLESAHPVEIINAWTEGLLFLEESFAGGDPDVKLSMATLLHHLLKMQQQMGAPDTAGQPLLLRALELDPEDREGYLSLIPLLRRKNELTEARRWVEQALKHFPEDIAILTEAVETALAGSAYKKAARIAAKILEKDPINQRVRSALINAHLSHTRKQIAQGKYPLAERELAAAAEWARSASDKALVQLVKGVLLFKQSETSAAGTQLQSAEQELGGGVSGRFYLLLELARQRCNITTLLKKCGLSKTIGKIEQPDLMQLFQNLNGPLQAEDKKLISTAFNNLKAPLKKCVHNNYSFSEGVQICETLNHFNIQDLRKSFAKAALKHWRRAPVYVYHELDAQFEQSNRLSDKELSRLEKALRKAYQDGEMGVTHCIEKLLEREEEFNPFGAFTPFDDDPGGFHDLPVAPDMDFLIDMLIDTLPPDEIAKMKKMMGEDGLRESLKQFIIEQGGGLSFDDTASTSDPFGAKKRKATPKKRTAKKKAAKKKLQPGDHDSRQMDLF
ncbi:MAG: hypothetical protein L3J26_13475 [Candidatus Polarisedimenticolaceae bacterium]|nr:hypothetical protein [Candidatus Polarisedimenticolaceae bacterium]